MNPISVPAAELRARRNAIACVAGLALVVLVFMGLELATEGRITLLGTVWFSSVIACGPFAGLMLEPALPDPVPVACATAAWAAWTVAVARGWLSALPCGIHLLLPVAWCLIGGVVGSFAAMRYT